VGGDEWTMKADAAGGRRLTYAGRQTPTVVGETGLILGELSMELIIVKSYSGA
jgi:hypothetical protein